MTENRKGCIQGTRPCHPEGNLAQTVHCVAHHGRHPFGELAHLVNKRSDALSRMTNPSKATRYDVDLTLGLALRIGEIQRDPRIAQEFCRQAGGVFVPLDARDVTDQDVHLALLKAVSEIGEDSSLITRVLSDGAITADEADAVDAEIDETIQALLQVKARVRAKVRAIVPVQIGRRA